MKRALARIPIAGWAALALALLSLGGYFAFHALFVKVGRSVEQPYSGAARHNPYYVLQRYLEERGLPVRVVRSWPQTLHDDALLLWFSDADVPRQVRSWLAAGGQLWSFHDPDPVPDPYEWSATEWDAGAASPPETEDASEPEPEPEPETRDDATGTLAESTQGAVSDDDDDDDGPDTSGKGAGAEPASDNLLDEDLCAEGCLEAAQFRYGAGRLTLLERWGLENEQVSLGTTPARIDALLGPKRPASVLIVTSTGSPWFGELLLAHAPGALLSFAALLALALWRAGKHFGARYHARAAERRQMLEHVAAVGMLASRVGLAPLLAAARNQLRRQILGRVPHAAALSDAALVGAVAEATEVPPQEVRRALLDELGGGRHEALAIARAIQAVWRKT